MSRRYGFIGVAAVAVVLIAVTGALWLGERPLGEQIGRVLGLGIDRSEAAQAFGIPEHAVVIVGNDAVGLRVADGPDSATFELLMMEAEQRKVRQVYQYRLDVEPNSSGIFTQPVRCSGVLSRDVYAVIGMAWPAEREQVSVGGIDGETAAFLLRDRDEEGRVAVLLVASEDEVDDDSMFRMRIGGTVGGGGNTGPLGAHAVSCAQPATARCGDWSDWEAATRASMAGWLTETRTEAVRVAQQLPEGATEAEVVGAAVSSIDKICQGSPPGERLTDIVERLYD